MREKEVAFSLRSGLSGGSRDALYALLLALADRVDDEAASYAELGVKMRMNGDAADALADMARQAGATPNVREV